MLRRIWYVPVLLILLCGLSVGSNQNGSAQNLAGSTSISNHSYEVGIGSGGRVGAASDSYALLTSTPVPPRCPGETFTDVCPGDYFYTPVVALNQAGIVSGYNTSPPCLTPAHVPCFLPANNVTRGQTSKIISLAAGFNEPVSGQSFEDVPVGSTFYEYIERLSNRGIISGYPCGGPGEPCIPPDNKPYFRPNAHLTRGQLSKIASESFGYNDVTNTQTFEDVPVGSTFHTYIERLAVREIINGYPCGGAGEPCVAPGNRPYFRPGNQVTRAQTAKIVYLAMIQPTPTSTPTIATTSTPTQTGSPISTGTIVTNTPVATPTCCTDITGSISASCQPNPYSVTYTINNSCAVTVTANISSDFLISPNINGPWQPHSTGDCFSCPIPPGTTEYTRTVYWGPLPAGNNYWRYVLGYNGEYCNWRFVLDTGPQPACVLGTVTPINSTSTSTPTSTPIPSPTCCTDVTGSITPFCGDVVYAVTYIVNNSCTITKTAFIASYFEVSPNPTGPWQPVYVGDCFSCPVPPGSHEYTETVWSQALPAGNNYWRYHKEYSGADCSWHLSLISEPQPACIAPTPSPTPQRRE